MIILYYIFKNSIFLFLTLSIVQPDFSQSLTHESIRNANTTLETWLSPPRGNWWRSQEPTSGSLYLFLMRTCAPCMSSPGGLWAGTLWAGK